MKTILALIPIVILSLMPSIGMLLPFTTNSVWVWAFLLTAFFGVFICFFEISIYVKVLSVIALLNVFLSRAPVLSQFAYMEFVACLYLYILCLRIDNWRLVRMVLSSVFIVNIILCVMQYSGLDTVTNFGVSKGLEKSGVFGNPMQFRSYLLVLVALLLQGSEFVKVYKREIVVLLCMVIFAYLIVHQAFIKLIVYRVPVWTETIRLSMLHPFAGWGLGVYKAVFNSIAHLPKDVAQEGCWLTAHNDWLQVLFEMGIFGFGVLVAYAVNLIKKCEGATFFGACLIGFTLTVHFPMRTIQIVPLLILFVAYIERIQYVSSK